MLETSTEDCMSNLNRLIDEVAIRRATTFKFLLNTTDAILVPYAYVMVVAPAAEHHVICMPNHTATKALVNLSTCVR